LEGVIRRHGLCAVNIHTKTANAILKQRFCQRPLIRYRAARYVDDNGILFEHGNVLFDPLFDPTTLDAERWLAMTEEEFQQLAGRTAMTRAGLERIKGNIKR
jgi:hypothetical protein